MLQQENTLNLVYRLLFLIKLTAVFVEQEKYRHRRSFLFFKVNNLRFKGINVAFESKINYYLK